MRKHFVTTAALVGLGLTVGGTPAMAGYCGQGPQGPVYKQNCHAQVVVLPAHTMRPDPVVVHTSHPMGHLRTIQYYGAPHVNIMRVHGLPPTVNLNDVPTSFTGGCHPNSTQYCRKPVAPVKPVVHTRVEKVVVTPPAPQPVTIVAPKPAPVVCHRPAPRPQPLRVQVVHPIVEVPVPVPTPLPTVSCMGGHSNYHNPVYAYESGPSYAGGLAGGPPSMRYSSTGH